MLTAQNIYSHPDFLRDQLFRTPIQGRAGLGPPIPLPELNSQGASGPLPKLRQKTKAAQPQVREPKEGNRRGWASRGNGLAELKAGHLGEAGKFAFLTLTTLIQGAWQQDVPLFCERNSVLGDCLLSRHTILG